MSKILMIFTKGFEEIEAFTIVDVCRRAKIKIDLVSLDSEEVIGAHNIKVIPDFLLKNIDVEKYDMIVLPGGLPNAFILAENDKVLEILKYFKNNNKYICAICAAPYALHKAGVLNKEYTCYPSIEEKIGLSGYLANKEVVQDGKVITSQGPSTAMKFALHIIKALSDEKTYKEIQKDLLILR